MKTPWVIAIVAGAHILAVAGIMVIQGCGTTQPTLPDSVDTVMPPSAVLPAPTPVAPPPPPQVKQWPPAGSTEYVIKKGDSLSKIAARYGVNAKELAALNGIDNPNMIRVGQKISLPGKVDVGIREAAKPAAASKPAVVKASEGSVYVVKPGDCLSKIAASVGCKTKDLQAANKLTGDKIFVGQKLIVPGGSAAPAVTPAAKPAVAPTAAPNAMPEEEPSLDAPVSLDSAPVELPDPDMSGQTTVDMREHIVGEDEDLPRIAMRYGVTVTRLKEMNGLADGVVHPGQKIKIPIGE